MPPTWHQPGTEPRWPPAEVVGGLPIAGALAVLLAAGLLNIALQSRLNSLAMVGAAFIVSGLVLAEPARRRLSVLAPTGLALTTITLAVIRSSPWVTVPCFAITIIGLVAASQDRLFKRSDLLTIAGQYIADLFGSFGWLSSSLRRAAPDRAGSQGVWRGVLLAAIVTVPIAGLLASADAVFGQVLVQVGSEGLLVHLLLTAIIVPPVAALVLSAKKKPDDAGPEIGGAPNRPVAIVEATIVMVAVIILMSLWGVTQVVVALGGADRLLATANLTAAENARQGFFQLVAVAALLIAVIAGLDRFTERNSTGDNRRFLFLTALVGIETLGLVLASYSRLSLYVGGFGNTMLRTAVAWFLAWLAIALVGLIVAINRPSLGIRASGGPLFLLVGLWVVGFAAYNPEAAVARGNLEREQTLVVLDQRYLTDELGLDAVPVLVDHLPQLDPGAESELRQQLCALELPESRFGPFGWNHSVATASDAIHSLNCP